MLRFKGGSNVKETYVDLLRENPIFGGLNAYQIQSLLPCITHKIISYQANHCIYHKGDAVRHLGIVLHGHLVVCNHTPEGDRVIVANIEENDFFGEAIIFATGGSVPNDVYAKEESTVIYLTSDFFLRTCGDDCQLQNAHTVVMKNMLGILSDRAMLLHRKISYLTAPDLKTKIAMYLSDLHDKNGSLTFQTPLNRDELAEFLAVARPSLSREFANLKTDGIIDYYRSSIKILDLERLQTIANQC